MAAGARAPAVIIMGWLGAFRRQFIGNVNVVKWVNVSVWAANVFLYRRRQAWMQCAAHFLSARQGKLNLSRPPGAEMRLSTRPPLSTKPLPRAQSNPQPKQESQAG